MFILQSLLYRPRFRQGSIRHRLLCCSLGFVARGDDRSLTDVERDKLQILRWYLVDQISLNGLVDLLSSVGCISDKHREVVNQPGTVWQQIGRLMDIIERRSFTQYKQFVESLRLTAQSYVADYLERDGGKYLITLFVSIF